MKPVILDDTKALNTLTVDFSNGLGVLSECGVARVTEEANGLYEAEFEVPIKAKHFAELHIDGIIRVKANEFDEPQLFRIYKITKPLNGVCTVFCQHISYDLTKVAVKPFKTTGAVATLMAMANNIVGQYPFTFTTDIENTTTSCGIDVPVSVRNVIGGREGSFIDCFGGELHWNNLNMVAKAHRGADRGVRISYGKNLVDYRQEVNNANTYNAVIGYASRDGVTTTGDIQYAVQTTSPKTLIVDFTNEFDTDEDITVAKLNAKAQAYIQNNDIGTPNVNIAIDFIHLWQTKEYAQIASLERVALFDTVHVFIPKLNVEASAKVVKTVYDPIAERYTKIELGSVKANLGSVITEEVNNEINNSASSLYGRISGQIEAQIERATAFLTGAEGGYQVTHYNADGLPYETLWMNAPSEATATNILRINANGLGFSNDGGLTYRNAWLIDGTLNADFIGTGTITAINIVGSTLTFGDSPNTVTLRTNDSLDGALFEGAGKIQFQTKGEFYAKNLDSDSHEANRLKLVNNSIESSAEMYNYRNNVETNQIDMSANASQNSIIFRNRKVGVNKDANRVWLMNDGTYHWCELTNYGYSAYDSSGNPLRASQFVMSATTSSNNTIFRNYDTSGQEANYFMLESTSTANRINFRNKSGGTDMNSMTMSHSSSENDYTLQNRAQNGSLSNVLTMNAQTEHNYVYLYNYGMTGSTRCNGLYMSSTPTYSYTHIDNKNANGNLANEFELNSGSSNSIHITNYQSTGSNVVNAKMELNGDIVFTCQNRVTFQYNGQGKQFVVNGASNGVVIAADGINPDAFLYPTVSSGRVYIVAPSGLFVVDQNGARTRQL